MKKLFIPDPLFYHNKLNMARNCMQVKINHREEEFKMKKLEHDLLTSKYTQVLHEENSSFNAPHNFTVINSNTQETLATIHFQEGAIKEAGINGVMAEDLIGMCIHRLQCFQNSDFACRENAMAITKLEEALMWLRKRTIGRENRGVEGTHSI